MSRRGARIVVGSRRQEKLWQFFSWITTGAFFLTGVSCSSLPTDYPKAASTALKIPPSTGVSGIFERAAKSYPGKSGFAIIPDDRSAFTDRIALADFAQKTIDVQYFIWSSDTVGRMISERLIEAAERGVRVRFLLDDVNFKKRDSGAARLSAHPNIEVRIFNPHMHRSLRALEFGVNFGRLNKRMHNKIMVMDNACAIIGGRNIADEYFGLGETQNNRDLDIVAVGPIVRDVSSIFDEFWNSPAAVPIEALVKEVYDIEDFRKQLATMRSNLNTSLYHFPLEADLKTLRQRLNTIKDRLVWARAEVIYDTFKSMEEKRREETVALQLNRQVMRAEKELLIESAYFVMRDQGIDMGRQLTSRGVKVRVLTNSLASNNVVAAQSGHSKRRKPLLAAGVDLYELRPDAVAVMDKVAPQGKGSTATLHSKVLVIDEKKAFVGSYNLDPRSANINSELGIMVYDSGFAKKVKAFLDEGVRPENAYHVVLDENGKVRWSTTVDGEPREWTKDPETSAFKRMQSGAIGLLPIEGQL